MTVSAPQMQDHCSFSTSSSMLLLTAEFPKLAFTFVKKCLPATDESIAIFYFEEWKSLGPILWAMVRRQEIWCSCIRYRS